MTIIESECMISACERLALKKTNRQPDMFVAVDYGEYDMKGRLKRIGKLGHTEVVEGTHHAVYKTKPMVYKRKDKKFDFKIRAIGFWSIQLYQKDYLGQAIINITDTGKHTSVEVGIGSVTLEVFLKDHRKNKAAAPSLDLEILPHEESETAADPDDSSDSCSDCENTTDNEISTSESDSDS